MLRLVKKYMGGSWLWAVAAPLFMLIEVMMDLMQPTLMSEIVDIGVATGNIGFIMQTGGKMLVYALVGVVGGLGCTIASSFAAVGFAGRMREGVFRQIQAFSFVELDQFKTSSLITRLTNDVTSVQQIVMMGLRIMVRSPLLCLGSIFMAYRLSPALSLVLVVALPILLLIAGWLMSRAIPLFMTMQTKVDRINGVMRENLLGIKVVKSFVSQEQEQARFGEANRELMHWSVKAMGNMIILFPLVNLVMNLSVVAVLWFGGGMAIAGNLEIGKIMAFINYFTQILSSMMMVVMISMGFIRARVSAQRLNEVLDTEATIRDGRVQPETLVPEAEATGTTGTWQDQAVDWKELGYDIQFCDVSFRHHNSGEYVLKHISLTIHQGQTVGIIGTTGSGKSTLVSLIPRLYEATEGHVLVGGRNVRQWPLQALRSRIGMVLQESILFAGDLAENLTFGNATATMEEMLAAAADAQALSFIQEKDGGFNARVEQRGHNFSGGQKQRLSIARTLLRRPDILILDDATSAVDMVTEARIREAIGRRMGSCTLIIIAQRVAAIKDADLILVLNEGEIEAQGSHDELLQCSETYRHIAVAQMGEEVVRHVG